MPLLDEFGSIFKTMRMYLFGRGLLSLLVIGTTMAMGTASLAIPALVAVGGLALSAITRLYSQRIYEDEMADLYREDVAQHLGMDPRTVTREHLKIAARENEVIEQALARQRRINIVSFATSALAAAASFGLLMFGLAGQVSDFFAQHFSTTLAPIFQYTSVGIVSGISSLVLHNGLEEAIGYGTCLSKAAAHDLIMAMDRDVKRGRSITPEQVYAVLVAENPALDEQIAARFKVPYHQMKPHEQHEVLTRFGITADMAEIAGFINRHEIPPGRLAYMMHDARPGKHSVTFASESADVPKRGGFVDRLGLAERENAPGTSHAARVDASRTAQALSASLS